MRRVFVVMLAVMGLVLAAFQGASAQAVDPNTPVSSTDSLSVQAAEPVAAAVAEPAPRGLPERVVRERTMRAYGHVFVAFAVTWILLFGYVVVLGRRLGKLDEEVQRLSRTATGG